MPTEVPTTHRYPSTATASPQSSNPPPRFAPSPHAASHSTRQSHPSQQPTRQQHPLLVKRVYALEEYARIFATRKKGQTKCTSDELPTPIPVPLRAGETFRDYEHQFVAWLQSRKMSLYDACRDLNHERSLRMNFANIRVKHVNVTTAAAQDGSANGVLRIPPHSSRHSPQLAHLPSGKRRNSVDSDDEDGQPRKRPVNSAIII
uniref:Uncharacterized protein n=1 Tax=Globisporangium ultimum (strain ATCC 200006 / CBS 805.95 / DAOM BR144) TaxID=431595 RepID=K3WRV0_GLOUD